MWLTEFQFPAGKLHLLSLELWIVSVKDLRNICGYQLLADHFRSHDRTEVTRSSQRDEFTTELESCCDIILTHLCDLTLFKSTVLNSGSESDLELNEKSPPENHHSQPITSDSASNDLRSENMKSLDLNDSAQNLLPLFDKQNTCNSFLSFNLRDLLELVKPFTSRDSYSIETFISDIEDMFRLYQITNLFIK
ncbi:transposon Tf2-9 polyprotein [Trichonephila clavipes]|nr:transposon Tf2-9 polyprotein [Trichonephila clavipes]